MTSPRTDPFHLLLDLERRSRGQAFGLPQRTEVRRQWHGIGFRLWGASLVAPLDQVREILTSPHVSRVPGAKEWVTGIANVRGTLLPILDLQGFLSQKATSPGRRSRVLVVQHGAVSAGLLVDEVSGLRHFFEDERSTRLPEVPEALRVYLTGSYQHGGLVLGIFDMHRLIVDPRFMQVAA